MKKVVPVSLVITVLNEGDTIYDLMDSIAEMSLLPEETVVVDGGSSDDTVDTLKTFAQAKKGAAIGLRIFEQAGNRSVGRNAGIEQAKNDVIAITDAGCTVDEDWLLQLWERYQLHQANQQVIISGYYQPATAISNFQQAVAPYVLVMPDKVDTATFLPATRSMLITRQAWSALGTFDESKPDNEDYVMAREIKRSQVTLDFASQAIVYWQPVKTLAAFAKMIFRFARGDAVAGLWRWKVGLLFGRYLAAVGLTWWLWRNVSFNVFLFIMTGLAISYLVWAIVKNASYIQKGAWVWLPILQITSDGAVIWGTMVGLFRRLSQLVGLHQG